MSKQHSRPKIGAHVSTAGGLHKSIENAEKIGAQCIQIFGASPQQWHVRIPEKQEIEKFKKALIASTIGSVFLHAAYLVNLASINPENAKKSIDSLAAHLHIAELIGAQGLIFHLGSSKGGTRDDAIKQTVQGMHAVLEKVPGKSCLIMENSAGGGEKLGALIEEIGKLYKAARNERVKVCIDTAHAFEAGVITEFSPPHIKRLCDELERAVGLENVVALHVNDSKTACGSHHDRHENIGEGHIGLAGFKALARERRLHHAAWILEVPGFENEGPDKKNIEILKSCFS